MSSCELINFYSFFSVTDPALLGQECYDLALKLGLCGTILVSPEGVNLALCGKPGHLDSFLKEKIACHTKLEPSLLRRCALARTAYRKLRLKIKPEIVTSNFATEPLQDTTTHLSPKEFHNLAQEAKDVVLVDMRNDYETAIGSFRNARHLSLKEFQELPEFCSRLTPYRDQRILSFCTGGVRCEKAVSFLQKKGFQAFQLYGGILHYLEKYGKEVDSLWEGECFVFDDRVALTASLEKGSYGCCKRCGQPSRAGTCLVCDTR